MKYC